MSREAEINSLKNSLEESIKKYKDMPIPEDIGKLQAIQLVAREAKVVSDIEKQEFEQKIQEDRYQLDKDHKYWQEHFEESTHKDEHALAEKRLEFESKKQDSMLEIEKTKLEIEKARLEIERSNVESLKESKRDEAKYRWISLGLTLGIPFVTSLISLIVYRNLAYSNLKLIYRDEGRPTSDFKDAVKCVKSLTK